MIVTAWNIVFAFVLVVLVFGWTGGKVLVGGAYGDAKVKVAEQKGSGPRRRRPSGPGRTRNEHGP